MRVDASKENSITGMATGRRGREKRNNREGGGGKFNDQVDAKRKSYIEAVIEGAL